MQLAAADLLKVVSHDAEVVDQGQNSGFSGGLAGTGEQAGVPATKCGARADQQTVSGDCGGNAHCSHSHQRLAGNQANLVPVDFSQNGADSIGSCKQSRLPVGKPDAPSSAASCVANASSGSQTVNDLEADANAPDQGRNALSEASSAAAAHAVASCVATEMRVVIGRLQ